MSQFCTIHGHQAMGMFTNMVVRSRFVCVVNSIIHLSGHTRRTFAYGVMDVVIITHIPTLQTYIVVVVVIENF